jgi:two-component system, chemotaxis family, protein-glutamate methylesterase/glutaminase
MNGFEATRVIMEDAPTPIVIVSGVLKPSDVATTFKAIEAGALCVVEKPPGIGNPRHPEMVKDLIESIKISSGVKVLRRWRTKTVTHHAKVPDTKGFTSADLRIVAVGASTGGPPAIQRMLSPMDKNFPLPIVIVQHIAPGFLPGMVDWLSKTVGFEVSIAKHSETLMGGRVYLAPDHFHMGVDRNLRVKLIDQCPGNSNICPSVSYLFKSVSESFGSRSIGVLLTGMGKDGSEELGRLKAGGAITFAQDKESSVIHGMPGEAIKLGGATYVLPPEEIGTTISNLLMKDESRKLK